jgi:hypothetical protein
MTFKAYLASAFCLIALFSTASANTITLSLSGSQDCSYFEFCDPVFWVNAPWSSGDTAEGGGRIFQVTGPHGQFAPISGGDLSFSTAPSYDAQVGWVSETGVDVWGDAGIGGSFNVSGSVFGFGPGTLLSGTFLSSSWSTYTNGAVGDGGFDSAIQTDYVNPVLLDAFGLQPNLGFVGSLTGWYSDAWYNGSGSESVGIDLVATPESSAVVLASLFMLVSGLAYLCRLRTRNCG